MFARVLLGGCGLCALACAALADEPKETKLKPTLILRGSHSEHPSERSDEKPMELIADAASWKVLWKKHRGKEPDPPFTETVQELDIDFETHYVVAIFSPGCYDHKISALLRGETVLIRYRVIGIQIAGAGDSDTPHQKKYLSTSGYAFVVLPKPVKAVIIEKDVQDLREKPPIWEEQKRFPAPKNNK